MIYKQREAPRILNGQKALLRRLRATHPKYPKLQKDYYNSKAGFSGEKDFDYQLREFRPDYPHAILHDVYLQQDRVYFQIDSLLITPNYVILCEVKNIAGKLHITQHPTQFIKEESNGERTVLKSPIEELERKKYFLTRWLQERGIEIPLVDFAVLAYQNELSIENLASDKVAFAYEMPNRLRRLVMQQEWLSANEIQQLAYQIKKHHRNYNPFPLSEKYDVLPTDLLTGVICSNCHNLPVQWTHKTWRCKKCGHRDTKAHISALHDWYCIWGPNITNQQLRQFLHIGNRHTARRLLNTPHTRATGNGRGAFHYISPNILIKTNESLTI